MGKSQRNKGARFERHIVQLLRERGIDATRVPLSGMGHEKNGEDFAGDILVKLSGGDRIKFEAKKRGNGTGFKLLYEWLSGHYAVVTAADRREELITLRLDDFIDLFKAADS